MQALVNQAKKILQENDREGEYTIPSEMLYPHLWAWDSAFAAIGWSTFDMKRACKEIEFLLNTAWEDGRIPHIFFNQDHLKEYFPGPEYWGTTKSSAITQPPAWGIALEVLLNRGASKDWIKKMIPLVEKSHDFFYKQRDPAALGVISIAHPWESGMDNCPAWDNAMEKVDTSECPSFTRLDKNKVEDKRERPTDAHYKIYMSIVNSIKNSQHGMGSFSVYDPMMTTMLALSELSLSKICDKLNIENSAKKRYFALIENLEKNLWNEKTNCFKYIDSINKEEILEPTLGAFFPLLIPDLSDSLKLKMKPIFEKLFCINEFSISTFDNKSPKYQELCYWRGPVWINTNWLFGVYYDLKFFDPISTLVEKSGFREYFNPHDGAGLGATNFTWAAALYLDLLERKKEV